MLDLDGLVEALSAAVADDQPPLCIRIDDQPGGGVGVSARSGVEGLLGWRAPAQCRAVGVIAGGWATRLGDDGPSRPGPSGGAGPGCAGPSVGAGPSGWPATTPHRGGKPRSSCRVVCVMDRTGRISARTEIEGRVLGETPAAGRLIDCLLRGFGLATPPSEVPAPQLLTMLWLAEVIDTSRLAGRRLGWDEAVRLHPVTQALAADGVPCPEDRFEGILGSAARCWTWGRMRRQCARGEWIHPLIDPSLAAWMDDGMFARWVLGGMRSRGELLREATRSVCAQSGDRLRAVTDQFDTVPV